MHPLETYYLNQAGRGLPSAPGSALSTRLYLQRGHWIGSFFGTLFRFVRPLLWTVCRTGGKIIADIAKNNSTDVSAEDISKHVGDVVTESTRRLVSKLGGRGQKRVRQEKRGRKKPKKTFAKRSRVIKRDIFS